MVFYKNIKLSTWRQIVKNNPNMSIKELFDKIRTRDFSDINFDNADFSNINFNYKKFDYANFKNASFFQTNFKNASFIYADFYYISFIHTNFDKANFFHTNFEDISFFHSIFYNTSFKHTNFKTANFHNANFNTAQFFKTTFDDSIFNYKILPEKGNIIGWKKCSNDTIVKLQVNCKTAVGGMIVRKCRCKKAKVLKIYDKNDTEIKETFSKHDKDFKYETGKWVIVKDWNDKPYLVCEKGIHFFITKQEAIDYWGI